MDAATWQRLTTFKKWGSVSGTYPPNIIRLFSPDDAVHEAIVAVALSATQKLSAALYGWDDAEVNNLFLTAWKAQSVRVKIALDASQAAGMGERPLLKTWPGNIYGNDLVIGTSRDHAISHDKLILADDCVISGSTNLSAGGEHRQNNEATIIWDARMALEIDAKIAMIFSEMLSQPGCMTHKQLLAADSV